jgi:hypothetical protein
VAGVEEVSAELVSAVLTDPDMRLAAERIALEMAAMPSADEALATLFEEVPQGVLG